MNIIIIQGCLVCSVIIIINLNYPSSGCSVKIDVSDHASLTMLCRTCDYLHHWDLWVEGHILLVHFELDLAWSLMSVNLIIDQQIGFWVVDVTSYVYDLCSNGLMFVGYEQSLVWSSYVFWWRLEKVLRLCSKHHLVTAPSQPPLHKMQSGTISSILKFLFILVLSSMDLVKPW